MSARGIRWTAVNTARRPGRCRALLLRDVTAILTRPARGERGRERERERERERGGKLLCKSAHICIGDPFVCTRAHTRINSQTQTHTNANTCVYPHTF